MRLRAGCPFLNAGGQCRGQLERRAVAGEHQPTIAGLRGAASEFTRTARFNLSLVDRIRAGPPQGAVAARALKVHGAAQAPQAAAGGRAPIPPPLRTIRHAHPAAARPSTRRAAAHLSAARTWQRPLPYPHLPGLPLILQGDGRPLRPLP